MSEFDMQLLCRRSKPVQVFSDLYHHPRILCGDIYACICYRVNKIQFMTNYIPIRWIQVVGCRLHIEHCWVAVKRNENTDFSTGNIKGTGAVTEETASVLTDIHLDFPRLCILLRLIKNGDIQSEIIRKFD